MTSSYGPPRLPKFQSGPHQTYGPPQISHVKANLGIRYGTQSGNLKAWPFKGLPPKQPLPFREPVPPGLIESLGNQVEHLDKHGYKVEQHQNTYIPPPPSPVPITDLHALPIEQPVSQFLTQHHIDNVPQLAAYESVNNVVAISHGHSCTQGPHLGGGGGIFGQNHLHGGDIYVNSFGNGQEGGKFGVLAPVLNYEAAASTNEIIEAHNAKLETPESSYGPPASGTAGNSVQSNSESLPGLDGLDVVSAQRSQSIDIPAQAPLTTNYEIQFQKSIAQDPQGSQSVKHEQIINHGLLQSIISAVEQPQPQSQPQSSSNLVESESNNNQDQYPDPSEVKIIFKKPDDNHSSDNKETEAPKESS